MVASAATAAWLALLGLLVSSSSKACPVAYSDSSMSDDDHIATPLLFGGYYSRCKSGCQPRDDMWSNEVCRYDPEAFTTINTCEGWQRTALLNTASQLSGGALEHFSPCDLYPYLQNRTLWLVGDSHTKGFYAALRCLLLDFWDHSQGECAASSDADLQHQLELAALNGQIYNTPPRCLHTKGNGRVCLIHSPRGDKLVSENSTQELYTLQLLLQSFAHSNDIIYFSFGRWHSNNCQGLDSSYGLALESGTRSTFPYVMFAVPPHDHSKCLTPNSSVVSFDEDLPNCLAAAQGGYDQKMGSEVARMAHSILTGKYGIPVIDTYNISSQLYFGHVSARQSVSGKIDCLHMCRPGMPEIDVFYFYMALKANNYSAATEQLSDDQISPTVCGPVEAFLFRPKFANQGQPHQSLAATPAGLGLHSSVSSENEAGMVTYTKIAITGIDVLQGAVVGTNTSELVTLSVAV
eukprot:gene2003-2325_t